MADFLEVYRIDLWGTDWDAMGQGEAERLAALAWQLGNRSRTWRALDPILENDTATHLLRKIELNQRAWAWAHTDDAKRNANVPVPITLPGEAEHGEEKKRQAEADAASVAAAFGI